MNISLGNLRGRCEFDVPDDAFMVSELVAGALTGRSGIVHFHEAFRNA